MSSGLSYLLDFMKVRNVNIIVYDYTGYGVSEIRKSSEESICRDLEAVLKWTNAPLSNIILWGFSLGTVPTISVGAKYEVGGVILQSPLASVSTFLDDSEEEIDSNPYDTDSFSNLENIHKINVPIIIFHS